MITGAFGLIGALFTNHDVVWCSMEVTTSLRIRVNYLYSLLFYLWNPFAGIMGLRRDPGSRPFIDNGAQESSLEFLREFLDF